MKLEGSCHCNAVRFSLESRQQYPFALCYCSICRKTAGSGGFAINLGGDNKTMKIEGKESLSVYKAIKDGKESTAERSFCKICGSQLWVWDPRWPDLIHPHASAIDTDLPEPPERTNLMLNYRKKWSVKVDGRDFEEYPDESLAEWHKRHGFGA